MIPRPKIKRVKCKKYLEFLRKQRCEYCGGFANSNEDVVAAHQSIGELSDISVKGMGQKNHDIWSLPEHANEHIEFEHRKGIKIENKIPRIIKHIKMFLYENRKYTFLLMIEQWEAHHNASDVLGYITLSWNDEI